MWCTFYKMTQTLMKIHLEYNRRIIFLNKFIIPSDSERKIREQQNLPHEKIKSLPTDLISIRSDIPFKSVNNLENRRRHIIAVEYSTSGTCFCIW